MKPIIDQNSAKPKDYDKWTEKEQIKHIVDNIKTYIPSIPQSLLFFIPGTLYRGDCGRKSMDKPLWLDIEKFQRGQKFVLDHFFSVIFANILSLFQIFAFTDGLKPLIFSQQSHTPYLAFKRYNFCRGSLKEIKQRSRDFIEVWAKPYLRQIMPEWEHMLRCMIEGGCYCYDNFTFKMLLLFVTNLMNIDMPRTRSTLTYYEWFKLIMAQQ
ncbi:hypothetical protein ALC57_04611 [Trachymyrmex cornetzi]|uniref:Uncharacterized protein n=1 Tax=Trachymyrmex cornetzi TaxID=471704 RepID=A0A195EDA3_9HYME|nr:hypothetical protein ALC57_04611 [Trachymyrmex cornetzi]